MSGENGDRGAYYTQDINDPAIVPDGKRYSQAVNAYALPMMFDRIYGVTDSDVAVLGSGNIIYMLNLS